MKNAFFTTKIILILMILVGIGQSQELTSNILLGQSMAIDSKHLGETREVFIYTPEGYAASDDKYPVLYVLDGETHFFTSSALANFYATNQQIPELIVVAIPNVPGNRNRNFTPLGNINRPNLGGAEKFIAFMREELMPTINDYYRTHDFNLLFGHSLTGMFSIYTLLDHTDMFNAFLTASPYVMWDDNYVVEQASKKVPESDFNDKSLFITIGDEPNYYEQLENLTKLFKDNETGLKWEYKKYSDNDHASIPVTTLVAGLGFVFSDWPLDQEIAMNGLNGIQELLDNRLQKYGIKTKLNEAVVNVIGYQLLQADEIDKAIEIFEYNVDKFPNSSNVYDSLGDGYDAKGKKKKALKNYRIAVELGTIENSPNLEAYKNNLERLENSK